MEKQLVMVGSITYAMKARDYLASKGYQVAILRTPKELSRRGCGYSVQVDCDKELAAQMLSSVGIKVLGTAEY